MGFLDNIGKSISQGVDRAKYEADKLQRTNKVKGEIGDLQRQVETNLRQLGERALELFRQGAIQAPEVGSLAQMIDQLAAQLDAKQAELTTLQNENFQPAPEPPAYGQQGMPPQGGYAPPQGGYQTAPGQPMGAATIGCPSCGNVLPANAAFCANCGARIQS